MEKFIFVCAECGAKTGDHKHDDPIMIYPAFSDDPKEHVAVNHFFISCKKCNNREKIYIST